MTAPHPELTMHRWLTVVLEHRGDAVSILRTEGIPAKVILRKAEASARRNLTDFGVHPELCWITPAGRAWLAAHTTEDTPHAA